MSGKIFILAGPSGVGKDTIMEAVVQRIPQLKRVISYTDREKRADDQENSYHFISREEFDHLVKEGEIFEWEYARDQRRYGSSKKEIFGFLDTGSNLIKIVGPKSFSNFKRIFGVRVVGIFIKYKNIDLLKQRLQKSRPGIKAKDLELRYAQAFKDMTYEQNFDFSIVNPEGHPEKAIGGVEKIIKMVYTK
jgi:guanylate kinase